MASPNLSEIVTTTLRHRGPVIADNFTRNNALMLYLKRTNGIKKFGGGRTISEPIFYGMNNTYQRYSGYDPLNISPQDVITSAEYAIRQAAVSVSISGLEMLQNSGEEAVLDLLDSRMTNAEGSFLNGLSFDIYSDGALTGQIGGLQALISATPTTGTVGGIDRATWAFWRNIAYSAATDGGAAATSANIQSYMNRTWRQLVRGTDGPNLIVADNNYWTFYLESLQAIQRIQTVSGDTAAGVGFQTLKYMGSDVVLDGGFQGLGLATDAFSTGGAASNTMYFINTKYLKWRPHADRNMVPLDPDRFSINQDAMVRLLGFAGNLTMSNARLQGVLKA